MLTTEAQGILDGVKRQMQLDTQNSNAAMRWILDKQFTDLYAKLDSDKSEIINLITKKK